MATSPGPRTPVTPAAAPPSRGPAGLPPPAWLTSTASAGLAKGLFVLPAIVAAEPPPSPLVLQPRLGPQGCPRPVLDQAWSLPGAAQGRNHTRGLSNPGDSPAGSTTTCPPQGVSRGHSSVWLTPPSSMQPHEPLSSWKDSVPVISRFPGLAAAQPNPETPRCPEPSAKGPTGSHS